LAVPGLGQQSNRTYHIGVLSTSPRTVELNVVFIDELRKLGFVEGLHLVILDQGYGSPRKSSWLLI
jgi:hypothetical protein